MDEDDSPFDIDIALGDNCDEVDQSLLREAIVQTLTIKSLPEARIDVAVVSDDDIATINEQYLQHTGPTDVISFDLSDESDQTVDGQLVISVDTARREASARGHGVASEVALYAVHGTLHLMGYDDQDDTSSAEMHAVEDRVLTSLGVGPVYRSGSGSPDTSANIRSEKK